VRADVAMDLGTSSTLIYVRSEGIVLHEPSLIAVDTRTNKVVGMGKSAQRFQDHEPGHVRIVRPLSSGAIADFNAAVAMIRGYFAAVLGKSVPSRLRLVVAIPAGLTQVERKAVRQAVYEAGCRTVFLLNGLMATAMGAGVDVEKPPASMVLNVGGGTTEAAVINLGSVVHSESVRIAGNDMDEAIVRYLQRNFHLRISHRLGEKIKVRIGCAVSVEDQESVTLTAQEIGVGAIRTGMLSSSQVSEALSAPVDAILDTVRRALENVPPVFLTDVRDRGIMLSGGGCLLKGLDELITRMTGIDTVRVPDPFVSVILGCGLAVEELDRWQKVFAA